MAAEGAPSWQLKLSFLVVYFAIQKIKKPSLLKWLIHFPGIEGLDKAIIWAFPKISVCLDCGVAQFMLPERNWRFFALEYPLKARQFGWADRNEGFVDYAILLVSIAKAVSLATQGTVYPQAHP